MAYKKPVLSLEEITSLTPFIGVEVNEGIFVELGISGLNTLINGLLTSLQHP